MFVFPMAGDSRRFHDAGYGVPKYKLPVGDAFVFDHAVISFAPYFGSDDFLFVLRANAGSDDFVRSRCRALGISNARFVLLDRATQGQAETVLLGLAGASDDIPVTVFNIDTFRPGYRKPALLNTPVCDGYLEVFRGEGANWSFVARDPAGTSRVIATAEKRAISDLCCTGLYYFRTAGDFRWAYDHPTPATSEAEGRERYVAPLYNALIAAGRNIHFEIVTRSDVIFCGTPEEYGQILASPETIARLARDA